MANTSRPSGLRPSRYRDGSPWNGQTHLYGFSASETTVAYKYDPCFIDSTNRSTSLTDAYAPGIPLIKAAVAAMTTTVFRGVIAGFVPQPEYNMTATASLGTMYRLASTARYGWVIDDTAVIFEVQETGNSYTSASSNAINKGIDIAYTVGNNTTGISATVVDAATVSTAAVKPFKILRLNQRIDNFNFTSADTNSRARWDVQINNSDLAQANLGA